MLFLFALGWKSEISSLLQMLFHTRQCGKPLPGSVLPLSARFTSSGSPCSTAAHDSVLGGASETVNSSATAVSIQLSRPQPDS